MSCMLSAITFTPVGSNTQIQVPPMIEASELQIICSYGSESNDVSRAPSIQPCGLLGEWLILSSVQPRVEGLNDLNLSSLYDVIDTFSRRRYFFRKR